MKKKRNILGISINLFFMAFVGAMIFIWYFNQKLGDGLIECAENEVNRVTVLVINNGIRKYVTDNKELNEIINISKNNQEEINRISYNTVKVNKILSEITNLLEADLANMAKGDFEKIDLDLEKIPEAYYSKINEGLIFSVSMGSATGNRLLANIGPKIPLNLSLVEGVSTKIDSKITEYGLNNAMLEVFLRVSAGVVIQMPFLTKEIKVEEEIPLTMEIIQGVVPNYYLGNSLSKEG